MYIPQIVVGVVATLFVEAIALIVAGLIIANKNKKNGGN